MGGVTELFDGFRRVPVSTGGASNFGEVGR